jgi:uncharacterized protein YndB with AHSA1/START domain
VGWIVAVVKGKVSMTSFTKTMTLAQPPDHVFRAINDPRAWWGGGQIEGRTDMLRAKFDYRYGKTFRIAHEITELVPNKKVVWHVNDADPSEWNGTDIVFELAPTPAGTELRFTHVGLVPSCDCYDACREGWTYHLEALRGMIANDYTKTFTVDQTPHHVYAAINNVRGWWSEDIEGATDKLGATFTFRYKDMHRSVHEIREMVPGQRVVWHIPQADINFVNDKTEWNNTDVVFAIHKRGGKTEVRFTHVGLVPRIECYGDCSGAWAFHLDSLKKLITTGAGEPNRKEHA